jgi:heme A synthase
VAVTVLFAGLALAFPSTGVILHEVAGALLLVLLLAALALAWRDRREEPRPVPRLVGALVTLIVTGSAGALLAVGTLPSAADALPLVGLVILTLILLDSLRSGPPLRSAVS